jgi:hypothetical protein
MARTFATLAVVVALLSYSPAGLARADEGDDEALFQKVMTRLLNSEIVIKDYPK